MPADLLRSILAMGLTGALCTCAVVSCAAPGPTLEEQQAEAEAEARRDATVDVGSELVDDGEYHAAIILFEAVIEEYPETVPAWIGLGDAHSGLKEWQEAEPSYAEAARLEPSNFDAQYGHGTSLQVLSRHNDALAAFHRALVLRPDSADAAMGLGTTYLLMGAPAQAVPFTRRAVAINNNDGRHWIALGAALEGSGDDEGALRAYINASETMDITPQLLRNLLNAYVRLGRYREVIGTAQTLRSVEGPTAHPMERTGWAWFKLGEYDRSAEAYRKATAIDPAWWRAWNGLGVTAMNRWLLSGRTDVNARDEAAEALRASLRLNPKQPKVINLVSQYGL